LKSYEYEIFDAFCGDMRPFHRPLHPTQTILTQKDLFGLPIRPKTCPSCLIFQIVEAALKIKRLD